MPTKAKNITRVGARPAAGGGGGAAARARAERHEKRRRETAQALRAAADRILEGRAQKEHRELEIENIWREAKAAGAESASHATLWRHPAVIEYFKTKRYDLRKAADATLPEEVIRRLREDLREVRESSNARIREMEALCDTLAQQVQLLVLAQRAPVVAKGDAGAVAGDISGGVRNRGRR